MWLNLKFVILVSKDFYSIEYQLFDISVIDLTTKLQFYY